jgi:hypothetical protein
VEHVTNFQKGNGANGDVRRINDALARFGQGQVRGVKRDADGAFTFLTAGKARLPVGRVFQHVCRHDEGVPTCTVDREG